jgi:hypothetical protein
MGIFSPEATAEKEVRKRATSTKSAGYFSEIADLPISVTISSTE